MAWKKELRKWYRGLPDDETRMKFCINIGFFIFMLLLIAASVMDRYTSCAGGHLR